MLDYQMVMVAREVSHERTQGLPAAASTGQGRRVLRDFVQGGRKVAAFLAPLVNKPANMVFGQRYQNRHRSLEGTT